MKIAFFAGDLDNFHFVREIALHFRQRGCEVRLIPGAYEQPSRLIEHVNWSDVSWFEFANGPLLRLSSLPKPPKKILCRLHRYEAYQPTAKMVDWSKIDDLISVSPFNLKVLRELYKIDVERHTRVHIIPNPIRLERYRYRRRTGGFRIACVTRFHGDKNPAMILQVMAKVVKADPRYRCFIAGRVQDPVQYLYFEQMKEALGLKDHVVFEGYQEDMDAWLEDKDYLLVTSLVESQNVAVAEAMAKGIKPIIHSFLGSSDLGYPQELLFLTVDEAVEKILEGSYQSESYRQFVEERFAFPRVIKGIERIVGLEGSSFSRTLRVRVTEDPPKMTAVIASYNRPQMLKEALESLLREGKDDLEIIVVDDGSEEASRRQIRDLLRAFPWVRLIEKDHTNYADSRNRGIAEAKGEWILVLDDDDLLLSGALGHYLRALEAHRDAGVFYGDLLITDALGLYKGAFLYLDFYRDPRGLIPLLLFGDFLPHPGSLIRKDLLLSSGGYDPTYPRAVDYELWTRLGSLAPFKHIGAFSVQYRIHDKNLTAGHPAEVPFLDPERRVVEGILGRYPFETLFFWVDEQEERKRRAYIAKVLGAIFYSLGSYQGAIPHLREALQLEGDREVGFLLQMARLQEAGKDMPEKAFDSLIREAERICHRLREGAIRRIVLTCGYHRPLLDRARKYRAEGLYDHALRLLEIALRFEPTWLEAQREKEGLLVAMQKEDPWLP